MGHVNLSGKLAETYPLAYEDVISSSYYTRVPEQVPYYESMFAGYRYFDSASKPVLFPFGYGLSYTTFAYRDLSVKQTGEHEAEARLLVRNTGTRDGAEVVQLYVAPQTGGVYRPAQELKAFSKVFLKAGEEKESPCPSPRAALLFTMTRPRPGWWRPAPMKSASAPAAGISV